MNIDTQKVKRLISIEDNKISGNMDIIFVGLRIGTIEEKGNELTPDKFYIVKYIFRDVRIKPEVYKDIASAVDGITEMMKIWTSGLLELAADLPEEIKP